MPENKDCYGCFFRPFTFSKPTMISCKAIIYPELIPKCPCQKCLVKTVCMDACDDFKNLSKEIGDVPE